MARTLELDTIQTPSANNPNIQLGSDTVTFSSNIAVDINNATIDGATIAQSNITVGPGKSLTVTDGTFTTSPTQKKAIIEGAGADVDLGAHEVRAQTFQSDVATGTAPLTVASTTKVANLNASTLDGATKANLFNLDHADVTGVLDVNHGGTNTSTTTVNKVFAGPISGSAAAPSFRALDRTDLPAYQGATSSAVGIKGAVPAANTDQRDQFLKGDGTYATPTNTNTVTSVGTSSSNRTSGNIDIVGGTNVSTSKSGSTITVTSTDTNTVTSVGTSSSNRTSGNIDIVGGTNVSTSKSGGTITINATDTNTNTVTRVGTGSGNVTSGDIIINAGSGVSVSKSGNTLTITNEGAVKFKSSGKASGNPGSGKTWIAYGHATYTNEQAGTYTSPSDHNYASVNYTGGNYVVSIGQTSGSPTSQVQPNIVANRYGTAGYGYGDVVSINTGSGWSDQIPSGASATWTYTLEFNDA